MTNKQLSDVAIMRGATNVVHSDGAGSNLAEFTEYATAVGFLIFACEHGRFIRFHVGHGSYTVEWL